MNELVESLDARISIVAIIQGDDALYDLDAAAVPICINTGVLGCADLFIDGMSQDDSDFVAGFGLVADGDVSKFPTLAYLTIYDHRCTEAQIHTWVPSGADNHLLECGVVRELHVCAAYSGHTFSIHLCARVCFIYYNIIL